MLIGVCVGWSIAKTFLNALSLIETEDRFGQAKTQTIAYECESGVAIKQSNRQSEKRRAKKEVKKNDHNSRKGNQKGCICRLNL